MIPFKLPEDFMMGTATAALQIEGGDRNNNWYAWCEEHHIKDGTHCIRANDHYNRLEEDISLMKAINASTYRMGLEWSRLEPEEGKFSQEAVEHYRKELTLLIQAGIKPIVTLFHFSYPLWFAQSGAFEEDSCIERFKRYARFCVESFGDLVAEWITINEPNVFAVEGYLEGIWPPGKKDMGLTLKVLKNLVMCHLEVYPLIHSIRKQKGFQGETRVGAAHHVRVFDGASRSPLDSITAVLVKRSFQDVLIHAMTTGVFRFPLGSGKPKGKGRFSDFLGINYYTRDRIKFDRKTGYRQMVEPGAKVNDLGWEIYPEGLYRLCKEYYEKYRLHVFITENGTCDKEDTFRPAYIAEHLYQVKKLRDQGIDVQRYYYWTLMDNFEWLEGESAPFGLIHCDFETQKRTIRKSGRLFAAISKEKGLTQEMIQEYLTDSPN